MHKKLLLLSVGAICALSGASQSLTDTINNKINPAGRVMLYNFKHGRPLDMNPQPGNVLPTTLSTEQNEVPTISVIVILNDGCDISALDNLNIIVLSEMDGIAVIKCPITEIEKIALCHEVKKIEFNVELQPSLDFARPSSAVSDVQNGFTYDGNTHSFDGAGVVCGMMDTGLDPNHINFKNSDGSSRIQRLWHMTSNNGTSTEYTPANISTFQTDNSSESHATHVAGIIGGSYKGNGKFCYVSTPTGTSGTIRNNQPIPYYGVSTGADLAFAVGDLYTPNIIQGVTNIIEYAESLGKPAVVNLSLGHTVGPHDGSDAYCEALAKLGKRAIICMSAGNDGDMLISITKTLDASGNGAYLRTFPVSSTTSNNLESSKYTLGYTNGIVDLWTDGDKPVTFTWKVYKGNVATAETIMTLTGPGTVSTSGNSVFSQYFNGQITMDASVDPDNNRYNVYSTVQAQRLSTNTTGLLMLEVSGQEGTKLYLYGSNVGFTNNNGSSTPTELTKGSAENSINDGCCGENVLSVGAYTSRTKWGCLDGKVYNYVGYSNVNTIAPFSSYGSTYQGKTLPLVSGPGSAIISSYSKYYSKLNTSTMTASAANGSATDYWGAMQGTSMSCPYVTGTIGLWLQADPTLTFDKVMDVINNSSTYIVKPALALPGTVYNGTAAEKVKWGAGSLNALEGIKYVLANKAAIGTVWADEAQRLVITASASGYDVFVADGREITVTLYDLQGRPVTRVQGSDGAATLSADGLPHGVYIIEARGDGYRFSRKVTR